MPLSNVNEIKKPGFNPKAQYYWFTDSFGIFVRGFVLNGLLTVCEGPY